jgi:hypothetical protein
MSSPRVLLACVSEDRPDFRANVEDMVGSARRLGGRLAHAAIVVNMVDRCDPAFADRLSALGAEVRIVAPVAHGGVAQANKLRMLELCRERGDFDILLATDCDVAVADDPVAHLSTEAISVVPADKDLFEQNLWREIFQALELEPGERSLVAGMTGRSMYPYFNSGVVGVPRARCEELLTSWTAALGDLDELWRRQPKMVPRRKRFYTDQLAFAIALSRGLPWTAASRELNFATHVPLHGPTVAGLRPAMLHHHSEVDEDGFLYRPRCRVAVPAADRVNRSRADALGLSYTGLRNPPPRRRAVAVRLARNRARLLVDRLGSAGGA